MLCRAFRKKPLLAALGLLPLVTAVGCDDLTADTLGLKDGVMSAIRRSPHVYVGRDPDPPPPPVPDSLSIYSIPRPWG